LANYYKQKRFLTQNTQKTFDNQPTGDLTALRQTDPLAGFKGAAPREGRAGNGQKGRGFPPYHQFLDPPLAKVNFVLL